MAISVHASEIREIEPLREEYRKEMNCQIIHDSIHGRAGWTREFALHLDDGVIIGYGSVAVAGPWRDNPALYEFFVQPEHRMRSFEAFTSLLESCGANIIETQSNARMLPVMLHVFARNFPQRAQRIRCALAEPNRFYSRTGFKHRSARGAPAFARRPQPMPLSSEN